MQSTREVPWNVFDHLRAGYVAHWAHVLLRDLQDRGYEPGQGGLYIPDSLADVVAWLWKVSKSDEAAILVADYMACLRVRDELIDEDSPRVRLEDVLGRLRWKVPSGTDGDRLVEYLRVEVPKFYGDEDLNA